MDDRNDRTSGVYWRVMWSADWRTKTPWTLSGRKAKYIGSNYDPCYPTVKMYTFGPLAIVGVGI